MADLKIGEAFEDRVIITNTTTGVAVTGLSPVCVIIDESGNRVNGTVAEMSNGWYKVTDFQPDAAGTWCTEWQPIAGYTIYHAFKEFKVEGGLVQDVDDKFDANIRNGTGTVLPANTSLYDQSTWTYKGYAHLGQVLPAQNTWYTALATTVNCLIHKIGISVADTGETLNVQITVDGKTITSPSAVAAAAGTEYWFIPWGIQKIAAVNSEADIKQPIIEGRSVKVEFRKTTAAGTGIITCDVEYSTK